MREVGEKDREKGIDGERECVCVGIGERGVETVSFTEKIIIEERKQVMILKEAKRNSPTAQ